MNRSVSTFLSEWRRMAILYSGVTLAALPFGAFYAYLIAAKARHGIAWTFAILAVAVVGGQLAWSVLERRLAKSETDGRQESWVAQIVHALFGQKVKSGL
jgi:hypothetical protein